MNRHETTRQAIHVLLGTALLILHTQGLIHWHTLLYLITGGLIALLILATGMFKPLHKVIELDQREDKYLPGYGALSLIGGFLITTIIFEERIAVPALIILIYADSAATIIGLRYGKTRMPWNEKKSVQGTIGAVLMASILTTPLIGMTAAIVTSAAAMITETLPTPRYLDDNLLLPVVAGITLTIII